MKTKKEIKTLLEVCKKAQKKSFREMDPADEESVVEYACDRAATLILKWVLEK